jgi:hypothetical protein
MPCGTSAVQSNPSLVRCTSAVQSNPSLVRSGVVHQCGRSELVAPLHIICFRTLDAVAVHFPGVLLALKKAFCLLLC